MTDHKCFTVETTRYIANLDAKDRRGDFYAIHYQAPPKKTDGGQSISLRIPTLIVCDYLGDPQAVARKVANILEKHWNEEEAP